MIFPISTVYSRVVRPLLFSLEPETAHHAGLAGLKLLGLPGVRRAVRSFSTAEDPALRVAVGGLSFPNPVGLAAGFDKNAEAVAGLSALGFGFLEVGTLTPRPQAGNPGPRVFRVPEARALVNRLGFNNVGIPGVRPFPHPGVPVGFNIGKNKDTPNERAADDYLACLEAFYGVADFFVVNVSSPNTPGLRDLQAPSEIAPLLTAVARRADALAVGGERRPLFVKISPDEAFGEAVAEVAVKAGFDGLVATNTTRSREGVPAGVPRDGGLSGGPLFARSTEWVRRIRKSAKGKLAIIGVGGVFSARDAYEKILAGASLVEVYTGFIYEGPGLPKRINEGLSGFLKADGFKTLSEAVGKGT